MEGMIKMSKTIQVRVDDTLKNNADNLFSSLGLDTSTAVRMFLIKATEMRGFPFPIVRTDNNDSAISDALARRRDGVQYLSSDEFLLGIADVIKKANHAAS